MKNNKIDKTKISLILNYIIIALVIVATIIMFVDYKITFLKEPVLERRGFNVFKLFTVDANMLMGLSALLLAHKERKLLTDKIKDIPVGYYIFKYITTVSTTLTFVVVFFYLGRINSNGLSALLQNSNIFFHLAIPVLGIISFVIFERTNKLKLSYIVSGLIPVLLYGIFYVLNSLNHIENGKISAKYDWYWFMQGGMSGIYKTVAILFALTLAICFVLWILNRKRTKK